MSAQVVRFQTSDTLPFERTVRLHDAFGETFDLRPYEVCFVGKARADSINSPVFNYTSVRDNAVMVDEHSGTIRFSIPRAKLDKLRTPHYALSLRERNTGTQLPILEGTLQKAPVADEVHELDLFIDGDTILVEAYKRLDPELFRGPPGKDGEHGKAGEIGIQGPQGDEGPEGPPGQDGQDGKRGPQGDPGPQGKQGPQGDPPEHQWRDTELRFRQPDGQWGIWVDLQGPMGKAGRSGGGGGGGGTGSGDSTPGAPGAPGRSAVASFPAIAYEPIPAAGMPVNVFDNGGTLSVRRASALDYSTRLTGWSSSTAVEGQELYVELAPYTAIGVGLAIDDVYLSEVPGELTNTCPTSIFSVRQRLGYAISDTVVILLPLPEAIIIRP